MSAVTKSVCSPSVAGLTFLITGGDSGIGRESARALASAKAHVVIANKNKEKAKQAVQMIQAESPEAKVEALHVDLASLRSVQDLAKEVQDRDLKIHALANNAGVFLPPEDFSEEDWEITMAVNHFAPVYLTHLLMNNIKANRPSRIVNLGSLGESFGRPDWRKMLTNEGGRQKRSGITIYGTTKMYNIMMAREYARRLTGQGVDCFACQPGVADTELYDKVDFSKPETVGLSLFNQVWGQSPEKGAVSLTKTLSDPSMTGRGFAYVGPPYKGGLVLHFDNTTEPGVTNPITKDAEAAKELYNMTAEVIAGKGFPDIMDYLLPDNNAVAPDF